MVDFYYIRPKKSTDTSRNLALFESVDSVLGYVRNKLVHRKAADRFNYRSSSMNDFITKIIIHIRNSKSSPSPSSSSPSSSKNVIPLKNDFSIENWFADALTLDWRSKIWPSLNSAGWSVIQTNVSKNNASAAASSSTYLMPNVKVKDISYGKNAFSSEEDIRRFLFISFAQHNNSCSIVATNQQNKTPSHRVDKEKINRISVKSDSKNHVNNSRIVTPTDDYSHQKDKNEINSGRKRIKTQKYLGEEYIVL